MKVPVSQLADTFLYETTVKLSRYSYESLSEWPEWPKVPDIDLGTPRALSKYSFMIMKDTLEDGAIRVRIQRYKRHFLGGSQLSGDGFVMYPNGYRQRFDQRTIREMM